MVSLPRPVLLGMAGDPLVWEAEEWDLLDPRSSGYREREKEFTMKLHEYGNTDYKPRSRDITALETIFNLSQKSSYAGRLWVSYQNSQKA